MPLTLRRRKLLGRFVLLHVCWSYSPDPARPFWTRPFFPFSSASATPVPMNRAHGRLTLLSPAPVSRCLANPVPDVEALFCFGAYVLERAFEGAGACQQAPTRRQASRAGSTGVGQQGAISVGPRPRAYTRLCERARRPSWPRRQIRADFDVRSWFRCQGSPSIRSNPSVHPTRPIVSSLSDGLRVINGGRQLNLETEHVPYPPFPRFAQSSSSPLGSLS